MEAHISGWKNEKHIWQWQNTLERSAYPVFGTLPMQEVDISLVMKVLEPIWNSKTETASRLRGRIESILDWANVRGYRQGWRGLLLMMGRRCVVFALLLPKDYPTGPLTIGNRCWRLRRCPHAARNKGLEPWSIRRAAQRLGRMEINANEPLTIEVLYYLLCPSGRPLTVAEL